MRNPWKLTALALCIGAHPILAHHSVKATYDTSALITLAGTVTKVDYRNPHVLFDLATKRETGPLVIERVQIATPGALNRRGFDRSFLKIGNSVSVEAWMAKDSKNGNEFSGQILILPDGKRFDISDNWP